MEFSMPRSGGQEGEQVIEEKKTSESTAPPHLKQDSTGVEVPPMSATERSVVDACSAKKEEVNDELESARVEMGEVREENQRLKMCLERLMKEYQALQMQFQVIAQQEAATKTTTTKSCDQRPNMDNNQEPADEESDLVSLSLGRVPASSHEKSKVGSKPSLHLKRQEGGGGEFKQDLSLGLECKFETSKSGSTTEALPNNNGSPNNSSELVHKEEEAGESWPPNKASLKTPRDSITDQDEVSEQNPAKKARVCVRARCDTPTLNDGCQWRKYGQKISKGNPCPRAYYRCTVAPNCPVRKQVQRYAEDMSVLITTYEGNHNHPLPLSATAMASTTSAAASMLLSGSSSTSNNPTGLVPSSAGASAVGSDLPAGINFYLADGSKQKQFYVSNPALSTSPSHPTITLDLTSSPSSSNFFSSHHFNRFNSNYNNPPRFPSLTSLSFGNSSSNSTNAMSGSNTVGLLGYNNFNTQPYNNNSRNILSSISLGRQLPIHQIPPPPPPQIHHQNPSLPDTIAAATKVITADPTFQSALAAALASIIGTTGNNSASVSGSSTQQGVGEINLDQKINLWGDIIAASASGSASNKVSGCGSSFLSKTTPAATQAGGSSGLIFLPPSLPFSSSKNASALSPADNRDKSNS